jgi:hypothetical protein
MLQALHLVCMRIALATISLRPTCAPLCDFSLTIRPEKEVPEYERDVSIHAAISCFLQLFVPSQDLP